ncbi:hypothetical protein DSECCO2_496430 [anaerobic digester metagenome]
MGIQRVSPPPEGPGPSGGETREEGGKLVLISPPLLMSVMPIPRTGAAGFGDDP